MTNLQKITTAIFILIMVFISIPQESGFLPAGANHASADTQGPDKVVFDVWVTAYSSTVDQTDSTPFITASGQRVRDGLIAANFLPFGSKVKIPKFFGDKVFVVQDRMHKRKTNNVDIWMPTKQQAINFGRNKAEIVVIETPKSQQFADAQIR